MWCGMRSVIGQRRLATALSAAGLSLAVVTTGLASAQPGPGTGAPATGDLAPQPPAAIKTVDELLDALETADKGMRTFTAGIRYTKVFAEIEGGDRQTWQGMLYFDARPEAPGTGPGAPGAEPPPTRKRFAVNFDTLIVGNRRRDETKHLIFDGEYLVEKNAADRQFLKRRVVAKGERTDPLRIGEGPFPLPIGQRKSEILKRLSAELRPFEDGLEHLTEQARARYADTVQLRLVPRAQARDARDLQEIRIWYRRSDLLPRLARTKSAEGSTAEVLLINQAVNGTIGVEVFNTDPPTEPGWDVDVREQFRGPGEDRGPGNTPGDRGTPDPAPAGAARPGQTPPNPVSPPK